MTSWNHLQRNTGQALAESLIWLAIMVTIIFGVGFIFWIQTAVFRWETTHVSFAKAAGYGSAEDRMLWHTELPKLASTVKKYQSSIFGEVIVATDSKNILQGRLQPSSLSANETALYLPRALSETLPLYGRSAAFDASTLRIAAVFRNGDDLGFVQKHALSGYALEIPENTNRDRLMSVRMQQNAFLKIANWSKYQRQALCAAEMCASKPNPITCASGAMAATFSKSRVTLEFLCPNVLKHADLQYTAMVTATKAQLGALAAKESANRALMATQTHLITP